MVSQQQQGRINNTKGIKKLQQQDKKQKVPKSTKGLRRRYSRVVAGHSTAVEMVNMKHVLSVLLRLQSRVRFRGVSGTSIGFHRVPDD